MGQTLFRAAQWTRATDIGKGKLEFTPLNEAILNSVIKFVENMKNRHPDESMVTFKNPFVWTSSLKLQNFTGDSSYVKVAADKIKSGDTMEIKSIRTKSGLDHQITAYNFVELANILEIAQDHKIIEARAALEANHEPYSKIFGDAFATIADAKEDAQILLLMDKVINEEIAALGGESEDAKAPKSGLNRTSLRLLLLLQQFDLQLMEQSFKKISSEVRLTPEAVENEVDFLEAFSGKESKFRLLDRIDFTTDVVTQFGCRAPLSRQFHGDICYLVVDPADGPTLYITCNTAGVFLNKGPIPNSRDLDYERNSDIFKDIRSLLKSLSPHFQTLITSQDFITYVDTKRIQTRAMRTKSLSGLSIGRRSIPFASFEDLGKPLAPKGAIKSKTITETPTVPSRPKSITRRPVRRKSQIRRDIKKRLKGHTYWDKLNDLLSPQSEASVEIDKEAEAALAGIESSSEDDEEDDIEEDVNFGATDIAATDLPSEYWQVQKLFKYVRAGNQTGTAIALIALRDYNLTSEFCQRAILEMKGLDMLLNLVETEDVRCKIASLKLLQDISQNKIMSRMIYRLSGVQSLVALLQDANQLVTSLAAQNIAQLASSKRVRVIVYDCTGVQLLVRLLKVDDLSIFQQPVEVQSQKMEETRCAALALWQLAVSKKVRMAIRVSGGIPKLALLLKNGKESLLIPVLGILQECLVEIPYQEAVLKEGMIKDIVKNLKSQNQELARLAAYAIFRCAENPEIRDLVKKYGGLNPLVRMLTDSSCVRNKALLVAITGAIWKCAKSEQIAKMLQEKSIIAVLIPMLADTSNEEVLVNTVGAIGECAQDEKNRQDFQKSGGIRILIKMLTYTNRQLLINTCRALRNCALERKCILEIDQSDGIRLLWSLLKQKDEELQAAAAWAICPCIEQLEESGDLVRSFVGGLTLMVKLLKSDSEDVLCSVCATIAKICRDSESLAVLTDNGVVGLLARLTTTKNILLQRNVAEAIAQISNWGNNRILIGEEKAIPPLVQFLKGQDPLLLRHTCIALNNLSLDPANCIALHRAKAIDHLTKLLASTDDRVLQEAAATCIANIRSVGRVSDAAVIHRRR